MEDARCAPHQSRARLESGPWRTCVRHVERGAEDSGCNQAALAIVGTGDCSWTSWSSRGWPKNKKEAAHNDDSSRDPVREIGASDLEVFVRSALLSLNVFVYI